MTFYDGNPDGGGTQIGDVQEAGNIPAGGSAQASVIWDTSGKPGNHTIYVRVSNCVPTESDVSNNTASKQIGVRESPTPVSVVLSPERASLATGSAQQFTATVTGNPNTSVTWYVDDIAGGNTTVGTITAGGLYTAPSVVPTPDSVKVKATSVADITAYDEAWIHISKNVFSISGTVRYFLNGKYVPNAQFSLSGDATHTVSSGSDGTYQFSDIEEGIYIVTLSKTTDLGGVNATDALKVVRHTAGLEVFTDPNRLIAGDVNNSETVNSTDALKIVRYTAGLDALPSGDWKFAPPSRSYSPLNSDIVSQDYTGIRMGDVNGSWTPDSGIAKPASSTPEMIVTVPNLFGVTGGKLEVPVRFNGQRATGALTMFLSYPLDLLSYEGMEGFSDHFVPVVGHRDGVVRIVWVDMTGSMPVRLDSGSELILKFEVLGEECGYGSIDLLEGTELADGSGAVIATEVRGGSVNIERRPERYRLFQNFPNPFNAQTYIRYSLPQDSHVDVSIYDIAGRRIITLVGRVESAGTRNVVWDGRDVDGREVSSGMYLCRLSAGEFTETRKMILIR